jgi:hypothetical protein
VIASKEAIFFYFCRKKKFPAIDTPENCQAARRRKTRSFLHRKRSMAKRI